jgi:ubiquinone/menaquinone biosynthesis C-methylase UbiE
MEQAAEVSTVEYWDKRYATKKTVFEYYVPWSIVKSTLKGSVTYFGCALNVGCGTSRLCADLAKEGFNSVISIDFSSIVIEHMQLQYRSDSRMQWFHSSCTSLSLGNNSIDFVIDKGTFDCLCASPSAERDISLYLGELSRILSVRGRAAIISFGPPAIRNRFFSLGLGQMKVIDTKQTVKVGFPGVFYYVYILRADRDNFRLSNI